MRAREMSFAAAVIIVVLHVLTFSADAGNTGGALVNCQTAHPSGAPISMTLITAGIDVPHQVVGSITVFAQFGGQTVGPFTATNVSFAGAVNQMDAGCMVFNDSGLGASILSAIGLLSTSLNFTACSLLGANNPDCTSKAPDNTIHTPLGWTAGQITGYAGH